MTKTRYQTLGKFERNATNEDAAVARRRLIAVSDGAGGGGLFADRWSRYLLSKLPASPIENAQQLDGWIGEIWESFYNDAEQRAKRLGGMELDKFYDEGAFATLAAVWEVDKDKYSWMSYGDSVVFRYDYGSERLETSFGKLTDFSRPPYLINCKDELNPDGFQHGVFENIQNSIVFVASDALSHYILMMYRLSLAGKVSKNKEAEIERLRASEEIREAAEASGRNSGLVKKGMSLGVVDFRRDVIDRLRDAVYDKAKFCKWLSRLRKNGLLGHDDYSLAVMYE
ncbi:MAG: hypothetical protein HDS43_06275 [Bacteroides sp.]|nr:hypothetical protein [Bacteroides sp.]